ncbi:MAG: hypothetical protein QM708_00070 [Propioniciclava sp.]|uniref:hypothetical protein n=1 Tax=Propioniciclava sp. TaxID=2038686 RepID=UPI0039E39238
MEIHWPWWLHPAWALLLLTGSMSVISLLLPRQVFDLWHVHKYLGREEAGLLFIGLLSFFIALMVASASTSRGGSTVIRFSARQIDYLNRAYTFLYLLTVVGYMIWMASAAMQGVQLTDLMAVVDRDPGAIGGLKDNARPIGGLTTLTQFGPLVVAIGAVLRRLKRGGNALALVFLLAAVRTMFYAERLALIEVLVPLIIVAAVTVPNDSRWRAPLRAAPLFAVPLISVVFAVSEYTRSWIYYESTTDASFVEWVSTRLAAYYVTAFNNSAMFMQAHEGSFATPYFSVPFIWNAPGVDASSQGGINGHAAEDWWALILSTQGNREFTNVGSFLVTYSEWGLTGMILFWALAGLIIGRLFARLTKGSVPALLAYAVCFVGILELPRFIYWTQGRATPIIVAAVFIALTYPARRSRAEMRKSARQFGSRR